MSTCHHHWGILIGRLFLRDWTSKDRVVPVFWWQRNFDLCACCQVHIRYKGKAQKTYRQFIRLTPLALAFPHDLPPLLNPRQRPTATNVARHPEWRLSTQSKVGTVLFGKQRLQIEVNRRGGQVCVRRCQQSGYRQVEHTAHQAAELNRMLGIEWPQRCMRVGYGRENVRGVRREKKPDELRPM
jgi:hypothetical protein